MSDDEIPLEECYEWAFQSEKDRSNLHLLTDLQVGVADLPETAGSFRIERITDYTATVFYNEMLWLVGSWRMPERLPTARTARWVNPNYVHKDYFFDITAECECGALMARERNKHSWDGEHNHTDDCRTEWRKEARKELIEARIDWLGTAAELWLTYEEAAPRMGIRPRNLTFACDRYGFDWKKRRKEGRRKAIMTWKKLYHEYDHTWEEIAKAWDTSSSTVRSYGRGHGRNIDV